MTIDRPVVAIDFGSSHTVAVVRGVDGRCRPLLFDGSPLLPSAVYAPAPGGLVVGRDALHLAREDPTRLEPFPKRRIDDGQVWLGDREVPVVELVAAVLARVAGEARRVAGTLPAAVLTYPVRWGRRRREVLTAAASAAGLTVVDMVEEPTAAAAYFTTVLDRELHTGQALAVFDFGGGTVDVTVVRRTESGIQALATGGRDDLGGIDLDAVVVDQVGARLRDVDPERWARLEHPESQADLRDRGLLWQEVRQAREMLSRESVAPLFVPGMPSGTHVTRAEFESAAASLLDQAVTETARTIERSGLTPAQLAGVFLVGGASRTPLVAQMLHRALGVAPTVVEQPETAVAEGAARSAVVPAPSPLQLTPSFPPPPIVPVVATPPARRRRVARLVATATGIAVAVAVAVAAQWWDDGEPAANPSSPTSRSPDPSPSRADPCPTVDEAVAALNRLGPDPNGAVPAIAESPKCWGGYAYVVFANQAPDGVDPGAAAILVWEDGQWNVLVTSQDLCMAEGQTADQRPEWARGLPDEVLELAGCDPNWYVD